MMPTRFPSLVGAPEGAMLFQAAGEKHRAFLRSCKALSYAW